MLKDQFLLKNIQLKNRLVMPPMENGKASQEGYVTEQTIKHYNERTVGGNIGLVITEHMFVTKDGQAAIGQCGIYDDSCIPGLKELTKQLHANGSKVFAQLSHTGVNTRVPENKRSGSLIAPSDITIENNSAEEMDISTINHIKEAFVSSAIRAKEAGYDGVEIHCAHAYLLNLFYSPISNKRKDAYGKTIEGRTRLSCEIISEIKKKTGDEFPVGIRFGAIDYMDGGSTLEEVIPAVQLFLAAGVDFIDVSGGLCGGVRKGHTEPGYFKEASIEIKNNFDIPVILTGGIKTAEQAEILLEENAADLIGVGRALYANASWAEQQL